MPLKISSSVREKLDGKSPPVTKREIIEGFANRNGILLEDTREDNRTDPPTQWFIARTDLGRLLKIVFIQKGKNVIIKTAYDPNAKEQSIFNKYGLKP